VVRFTSRHTIMVVCMALTILTSGLVSRPTAAQSGPSTSAPANPSALLLSLQSKTNGHVRVAYHSKTGSVRFIGTDLDHPVQRSEKLAVPVSAVEAAAPFVAEYGSLFGLRDPLRELSVKSTESTPQGRSFVKYQQVSAGVPVVGGELVVQTDKAGNLISMNGEVLPNLAIDTQATVSVADARAKAEAMMGKTYAIPAGKLVLSQPELWIFNQVIMGGPGLQRTTLVWRMEATAPAVQPDVREFILVDARLGSVALHFNQTPHAKVRIVCNANNVVDPDGNSNTNCDEPGEVVRQEGQGPTGNADVDLAYDYAGITYDYLMSRFGRNSLDGQGMTMISLVKYCPDAANCPLANANWNGRQMTYGDGYASADDVVGHEFAHGVTEFTAGLFYYYQSGAINESMSDVYGEFIDLTDGRGNDATNVRWLMGEDLPPETGAIRNMSNPGQFGDPDRTGSGSYYGGTADSGGVHSNSGVNNKAAALMVDGGTFNGYAITALGIEKTAQIYYEAERGMMTSATDYQDLGTYLQQACANLIGSYGITTADCIEVKETTEATQMHLNPAEAPTTTAPICTTAGTVPIHTFIDTMEVTTSGNWTSSSQVGGVNEWFYPSNNTPYGDITYATSGKFNIWGNNIGGTQDNPTPAALYSIAMTKSVPVPANGFLHFNHAYGFEADFLSNYDGGVVEYSLNNGSTWTDAGSLFINGGYNGTIEEGENPLGGRQGFVDHSNGYGSSRASLSSLAGQSIRFRFRIGTDTLVDDYGWFIDDVRIYSCGVLTKKTFIPTIIQR
jgi:bacillolysin